MSRYSGIHTIQGVKTTWLQNVGYVPVKPIEDFREGDIHAYNDGGTGIFISKKEISPKFWEITTKEEDDGKIYHSKVKKGTLKPYYEPRSKPTPTPTTSHEGTLKTIRGRHYLYSGVAEPVEISEGAAYKFVCDKVQKDFAGERVSEKKLREYADEHGFYGGWVESGYDVIKPPRSIESIERDIEKADAKSYKRTLASHAFGGSLPGGGALDRDMQRIWEGKRILTTELERTKQWKATPKPPSKTSMMKCIGGEIGRKLPADPDEIRKVFYDAFDTCISEV